jgi:hypothetical protein
VGIDRSDDADQPPAEHPDSSAARPDAPANDARQSRRDQIEPRSREEYYTALRAADLRAAAESDDRTEPAGRSEPGARAKSPEPTESGQQAKQGSTWEETVEQARLIWAEYKRLWKSEERQPVDRSKDPPGTWHSDSGRKLKPPDNERIDAMCDRISQLEKKVITPAMRAIEGEDPHRHLVGFDRRLKGRDRIKEKVCDSMRLKGRSASEAISLLPDAIRFTFQYEESRYTQGVRRDIARLQEQGFKLDLPKNYWSDDQYKGFNSQWIEPVTGQRFEVQFHTRISYEAKQITHPAYERLRTMQADPSEKQASALEELLLEAFQRKVTAEVPIPSGAIDIPDYPERDQNAR